MLINDIRQLEAFQSLARTGSFTETASKMGVTQSAISHSIKNLESALDCKLLNRKSRTITLTPAGEKLLHEVEGVLSHLSSALDAVSKPTKWGTGSLRIGIEHILCERILSDVLLEMRNCFPQARLEITTEYTPILLEQLNRGSLDMVAGISPPRSEARGVSRRKLIYTEQMQLFLPNRHPALSGELFDWSAQTGVILLTGGKDEEDFVENYLRYLPFSIPVQHRVTSETTFRELVLSGMGVGIGSPWMLPQEVRQGEIGTLALPDQQLERAWMTFSNDSDPIDILQAAFESLLERSFQVMARNLARLDRPARAVH